MCKQLRNAQNVDEIWQIFENVDQLNTQENVTKASAETTKETE
ncbi:hypothetical protein GEW_01124 [Pasteurella multocida subsp. gallicida str. Anand1_poultry]|nr:hypothetical protein GEW_01124 [Pasteurella multocida subsp. gallicida str. Anand1_poultry]